MKIKIQDDFDLYKITYSGQCFRARQLDQNLYLFITLDKLLFIKDLGEGCFDISCSQDEWRQVWFPYFDLEKDYRQIRSSIPKDDSYILHASIVGAGIRILKQDYWEMLISFITSQRKTIPAIRSSVEKMAALYGEEIEPRDSELSFISKYSLDPDLFSNTYSFPGSEEMAIATHQELASCGLGYRVPYILDAINSVNTKDIDLDNLAKLDDEELFDALKSIKGVGDKVANCIMLFAYNRLGRAPVDTWIKKVIDSEYRGINPFDKYGDVAGIMQQYVFYNAQHIKE